MGLRVRQDHKLILTQCSNQCLETSSECKLAPQMRQGRETLVTNTFRTSTCTALSLEPRATWVTSSEPVHRSTNLPLTIFPSWEL